MYGFMLSEILFSAVDDRPRTDRPPGLSCSGLSPCPYLMYKIQMGDIVRGAPTPQQLLNMADGWDQESQSIARLAQAGIKIGDRQAEVTVGKSCIPGHIDGTVTLDRKKRLWEHKAWASNRYDWFVSHGINAYLTEKAQVNAYMLGMGLDECIFFVKKKESNDYHDQVVKLNKHFILPIIEAADRIRLEGWIPEPKLCETCAYCGLKCFGEVVDFSWIGHADNSEMVETWKKGKSLVDVGTMLMEKARTYFVGSRDGKVEGIIGDRDVLLVEDLKILRSISYRFDVKKELVLKEFGPDGLSKVGVEQKVVQYRIREV